MSDQTSNMQEPESAWRFWLSLFYLPVFCVAGWAGGWWLLIIPFFGWWLAAILDFVVGLNRDNPDPATAGSQLRWHRRLTLVWPLVQFTILFGALAFVSWSDHLGLWEKMVFVALVGIASGSIGINYAHELMHQKSQLERILADILMTMVLYGHFRSEHLLVHHRFVATPKDAVTARYNENFYLFFPRVLVSCLVSAFKAEADRLKRKGLVTWHWKNPFWRYMGYQLLWLGLAYVIGGWFAVGLLCLQAFVAVLQLELVNYVEHYGLTRRHLGGGKYEHVKPHHSWNAEHRVSNYYLLNLQRHSDHHYKPTRRFPLLQTYPAEEAPQLPFGYTIMMTMAAVPPLWRKVMNPRVEDWREQHYPDIADWT